MMCLPAGMGMVAPASGGGGGDFPTLMGVTSTPFTSATTAHNVAMPATVSSGDLLLMIFGCRGGVVTVPDGWTRFGGDWTSNPQCQFHALYKVATGSEGGTTVNLETSTPARAIASVIRYQSGTFSGAPEISALYSATSGDPNPPALTPSWGAANTQWIPCFVQAGNSLTVSTYPYPDNNGSVNAGSTSGIGAGWCTVDYAGASLDPGSFDSSSSSTRVAATIAVRPA